MRRATLAGLTSAILFGLGAPLAKMLVPEMGPLVLAGLLYLGSGLGLLAVPRGGEARLTRNDALPLAGVVLVGGVVGPVLLLFGLSRLSAVTGSLLLNLEGPLTIALAVGFFGEHLGRLELLGAAAVLGGAALLGLGPGAGAGAGAGSVAAQSLWPGALAIALACLAWALDNNLTQKLSLKDPAQIVRVKSLAAGSVNLLLGFATGARLPRPSLVVAALALGALSYGASLFLHVRAARVLGAAQQAALFATAPFVGALAAVPLLSERLRGLDLLSGALMAAGVAALVRARHGHRHGHQPLEHEHLHVHDSHHQHPHAGLSEPEPHSHAHSHAPLLHDHPHTPDAHHRHQH